MPAFNPNSPNVAGLEWFPTRRLPRALKVGAGIGVGLASTFAESIASIFARLQGNIAHTQVGVDVYPFGSTFDAPLGGMGLPSADVAATAGWEQSSDAGVSFLPYQNGGSNGFPFVALILPDTYAPITILEAITITGLMLRYRPAGTQTEGHLTWQTDGTFYKIEDGTAGNDPTGRRIGWIEVTIAAKAANGSSPTIDGWLRVGDTNYGSDDGPRRITPHWSRYTFRFFYNPASGQQWRQTDLAEFIAGGLNSFGLSVRGGIGTDYRIGGVNIVFRSLVEERVATGYSSALAGDNYRQFDMLNPVDGSVTAWAKAGIGNSYSMVLYLAGGRGAASLNGVDQAALAEDPSGELGEWVGVDLTTYDQSAVPTSAGEAISTWAPSIYLKRADTDISVDSMAYVRPAVGQIAAGDPAEGQSIATGGGGTYGGVNVVVAKLDANGAVTAPDGPLTVMEMSSFESFLIEPADIPADGRFHLVRARLPGSVALAGTVVVDFSTTSTIPWGVAIVFTDEPSIGANGSNAGNASPLGVADTSADYLVNLTTVPPALTGFFAGLGNFDLPGAGPPGGPASINFASMGWDVSSLGGSFGYYELQRSDDGGTTYYLIAKITSEASNYFNDFECKRGIVTNYRVRVVRSDGALSDWTT